MPIQRRPPGSGSNDDSSQDDGLTPLQRYLAKKREAEAKDVSAHSQESMKSRPQESVRKPEQKFEQASMQTPPPPQPPPPGEPERPTPLSTESEPPADFFPRLAAYIIDLLILGAAARGVDRILFSPFRWLGGPDIFGLDTSLNFLLYHSLAFLYYGWFYSEKGASPGKIILQIQVEDAHSGQRLGYWRAFLRETLGKYISGIPLLLGFLLASFRQDHRALHDLIFDTKVIRKRN